LKGNFRQARGVFSRSAREDMGWWFTRSHIGSFFEELLVVEEELRVDVVDSDILVVLGMLCEIRTIFFCRKKHYD
jgi:hypothetical protein